MKQASYTPAPATPVGHGAAASSAGQHAHAPAVDPMLWMTALRSVLQTRRLCDVKMIGSHDSATYAIHSDSEVVKEGPACDGEPAIMRLLTNPCTRGITRAITVPWARCQEYTVLGQLQRGVRFLDIRLGIKNNHNPLEYLDIIAKDPHYVPSKEEIWTCHTVWASPWSDVVKDIAAFYASLPDNHCETLIIDVQSVDGFHADRHHELFAKSLQPIAKWLFKQETEVELPLICHWSHPNERILLLHRKAADQQVLRDANCRPRNIFLYSTWLNEPTPEKLVLKAERVISGRTPHQTDSSPVCLPPHQLCVCQGITTPGGSQIVGGLLCCCCSRSSVEDGVVPVNEAMLKLWETSGSVVVGQGFESRDHRNVLLLDFFDHGRSPKGLSAVELAIELNRAV